MVDNSFKCSRKYINWSIVTVTGRYNSYTKESLQVKLVDTTKVICVFSNHPITPKYTSQRLYCIELKKTDINQFSLDVWY